MQCGDLESLLLFDAELDLLTSHFFLFYDIYIQISHVHHQEVLAFQMNILFGLTNWNM